MNVKGIVTDEDSMKLIATLYDVEVWRSLTPRRQDYVRGLVVKYIESCVLSKRSDRELDTAIADDYDWFERTVKGSGTEPDRTNWGDVSADDLSPVDTSPEYRGWWK